jgi:hypothetical protein
LAQPTPNAATTTARVLIVDPIVVPNHIIDTKAPKAHLSALVFLSRISCFLAGHELQMSLGFLDPEARRGFRSGGVGAGGTWLLNESPGGLGLSGC